MAVLFALLGGCTTRNRQLDDAHQALAMRDLEIGKLRHLLEERQAREQAAMALKSEVAKLDERMATHDKLLSRLAGARTEVTEPEAEAASKLDAELEMQEFELELEESLAAIHALEVSAAARTEAYDRLLRQVELMVNTGRVEAINLPEGRIRFALPRRLDVVDPWQDSPP